MGHKTISDEKILNDTKMYTRLWSRRFNIFWEHQEELQQEIGLALLEARERFNPDKASWNTYATLRSRGAAIDFLRRQIPYSQRNLLILDAPPKGSDDETDSSLDLFASTRDDLTEVEVKELLGGISERYRKIILWMVSGYQQREIAQKLGLSEDRVWDLTRIIRENLRDEKKKF